MKILIALLIVSSMLKDIIAELKEGECRNLTLGDKSWDEICSDIQTYCILENEKPTCKCDNDMEFSSDEGRCIDILCEDGDRGFLECQDKNAICIKIRHENLGYKCKCPEDFERTSEERCIKINHCNDGKICEDEETTESNENFIVTRATTFSNEYSSLSTVSQVEISDRFSTNRSETTTPDFLSEKNDFSVDTSTHLSEETLPDSSSVTVETFTNPVSVSSLTTNKDDKSSKNEILSTTESSSTDGVNKTDSTEPTLKKSFIVLIVGIVSGVVIFVVVILLVLLILKRKECLKGENCQFKVGDYEKKLGALTPTFIHNENKEILKIPEKTTFSLSV